MDCEDPWYLTVIRTRGLRAERALRPIVCVTVAHRGHEHPPQEVTLGSDGQNPNLKSIIPVHDVNYSTKLLIQIFHKSPTKKKNRKRILIASASVSLNEVLNKHPLPHSRPVDYDVRLSCPASQRKSPNNASLLVRIAVPQPDAPRATYYESPPPSPVSEFSHRETDALLSDTPSSSKAMSDTLVTTTPAGGRSLDESLWDRPQSTERLPDTKGLRRRTKRRLKGFHIDSDSDVRFAEFDEFDASESSGDDSCGAPSTPRDGWYAPVFGGMGKGKGRALEELGLGMEEGMSSARILPMSAGEESVVSVRASLSFVEACVDRLGPYHELCEAETEQDCEKAEKVLARLLTEWYVVGASLLALASVDVAVFGFGSDSLFSVDGFSRRAISAGAISASVGLALDAWFLLIYSGADVVKFQRRAKDVYQSYFFFCLLCRLPTFCMLISTLALMAFVLALAWTAWPGAVLAMSFVAGVLLSLQFLVFGVHRAVNLGVWLVRSAWRALAARRAPAPAPPRPHAHAHTHAHAHVHTHAPVHAPTPVHAHAAPGPVRADAHEARMEMPVPCPSPAPTPVPAKAAEMVIVWAEHIREQEGDA